MIIIDTTTPKVEKDRFDAKLFNKIYEDNKLWESGDDGYGDWFTSEEAENLQKYLEINLI